MKYPNWFNQSQAQENFNFFLEAMKDQPVQVLQIGAYLGHASEWLLEHVLTHPDSTLTDVDTWAGSDEKAHEEFDWAEIEDHYNFAIELDRDAGKLFKYKMTSEEFFEKNERKYDFIYIDGSHTAFDVFNDGISAWDCLNEGGIIAFDDYTWDGGKGDLYNPRDGVDGFYLTYADELRILHCGTQAWFQKITRPPMLIEGAR